MKKRLKIFITIIAAALAAVHLVFPQLKIDLITVSLIAIAVVPWLETLFKSVELPGGVKLEFQELQKIETLAKDAGLIEVNKQAFPEELHQNTYDFVEIAQKNKDLALVSLRIEIEKRLRAIASKYGIDTKKFSAFRIIDELAKADILTSRETSVLRDMIGTLNPAAHGTVSDDDLVKWVIENGPPIVDSLQNRIMHRGVIFHAEDNKSKHWIDESFEQCKWVTNPEWIECISKHTDLWRKEMNNVYSALRKKLDPEKQQIIEESQREWEKLQELDKKLMYSFQDLLFKVGREGQIKSYLHFMNKVRERTLELEEILDNLI